MSDHDPRAVKARTLTELKDMIGQLAQLEIDQPEEAAELLGIARRHIEQAYRKIKP